MRWLFPGRYNFMKYIVALSLIFVVVALPTPVFAETLTVEKKTYLSRSGVSPSVPMRMFREVPTEEHALATEKSYDEKAAEERAQMRPQLFPRLKSRMSRAFTSRSGGSGAVNPIHPDKAND